MPRALRRMTGSFFDPYMDSDSGSGVVENVCGSSQPFALVENRSCKP